MAIVAIRAVFRHPAAVKGGVEATVSIVQEQMRTFARVSHPPRQWEFPVTRQLAGYVVHLEKEPTAPGTLVRCVETVAEKLFPELVRVATDGERIPLTDKFER